LVGTGNANYEVPVAIGASGSGKTTLTYQAYKQFTDRTEKSVAYIRIRLDFVNRHAWDEMLNINEALAHELVAIMRKGVWNSAQFGLEEVLTLLAEQHGFEILVLSLDEYQHDLQLTQRIVTECVKFNLQAGMKCYIVPIVSGIPKVRLGVGLTTTSSWQPKSFHLRSLDIKIFRPILYRHLRLRDENESLNMLISACGGNPRLSWDLVLLLVTTASTSTICRIFKMEYLGIN